MQTIQNAVVRPNYELRSAPGSQAASVETPSKQKYLVRTLSGLMSGGLLRNSTYSTEITLGWFATFKSANLPLTSQLDTLLGCGYDFASTGTGNTRRRALLCNILIILFCLDFPSPVKKINGFLATYVWGSETIISFYFKLLLLIISVWSEVLDSDSCFSLCIDLGP